MPVDPAAGQQPARTGDHPYPCSQRPLALSPQETAHAVGLSLSLVQQLTQAGEFPKPRQLSARRVGYLLTEIEAWLAARPVSECLPPPNSGYGRAGKSGKTAATA